MLNREYVNDIGKSELILGVAGQEKFPAYYEKMIFYNKLPNVLPFVTERNNGNVRFRFATDGRRPFSEVCEEKKPDGRKLKQVLLGIIRAVTQASEYLLDEQDFVIRADCIFEDANGDPFVCCLPGYGQQLREQFSELFEFLMNRLDYNDKRAVVTLYELYRRTKETICNFDDMRAIIEKNMSLNGIPGLPVVNTEPDRAKPISAEPEKPKNERTEADREKPEFGKIKTVKTGEVYELHGDDKDTFSPKKSKKGIIGSLLGKTPKAPAEKTTLLFSPPENSEYCLESEDGRQLINISKFPFFIGKKGANNDAELPLPQISRIHAKLTKDENNIVYLTDMQSLNGCFVNGIRLSPGEQVALKANDSVGLANINYHFSRRLS